MARTLLLALLGTAALPVALRLASAQGGSASTAVAQAQEQLRAPPPTPEPPPRGSPAVVALLELAWEGLQGAWLWLGQRFPAWLVWVLLASPVWGASLLIGVVRLVRARRRGGAVRGAGQAGRMRAGPNEEAPVTGGTTPEAGAEPAAPPELSRLEQLLLAADGAQPSLHETLVVLGASAEVVAVLREQASQVLDGARWAALAAQGQPGALRLLRERWILAVATERVVQWLAAQPSIVQERLQVSRPGQLVADEVVNLSLTQANGLGVTLKPDQRALLQRGQQALAQVYERAGDPYGLFAAAARSGVDTLRVLPAGVTDEGSALALPLLLHGLRALEHASAAGLVAAELARELAAALQEHERVVGKPVASEGSAVHALERTQGATFEGIGTFLAAAAGAAYSPSAVVMRLSKLAGERPPPARQLALGRLGDRVATALRDSQQGSGAALYANLGRILGLELVRAHGASVVELERASKTTASRQPLWGKEGRGTPAPDAALVQLHRKLLEQQQRQVVAARQLAWGILQQLAFAGKAGDNLANAQRRLGYAVAGFGAELVRGCDLELVSSAREVLGGGAGAGGAP